MFRFLQIFGLLPLGQKKQRGVFDGSRKEVGQPASVMKRVEKFTLDKATMGMTWGIILPSQNEGMEYK